MKILSSEAVASQIERIMFCLTPSAVGLPLPLNAAKRLKLSFVNLAKDQLMTRI